mmetsp:Transcript_2596/g.3467  ORF Transcript_2596/g.3467 Transcript_2596/m.3467 type:complete len:224 (+) Transcript_2596:116-787(+)
MRKATGIILLAYFVPISDGFAILTSISSKPNLSQLNIVDPTSLTSLAEVGVVMASAAAGALSQLPRISSLQAELDQTQKELAEESGKVALKMEDLEERMFEMDKEFEGQTARFKKTYDKQAKEQLDGQISKLKSNYEESIEIRKKELELEKGITLEQDKSQILFKALDSVNGNRQAQIAELRLENIKIQNLNKKLDSTVANANEELERLRQEAARKEKRFFLF